MQDEGGGSGQGGSPRRDTGPGQTLRGAREAQGLSRDQVAQDMHLDVWIVEAIERDDFNALGAPVFAKGYLRKYAKLLGMHPEDLLIAYYRVRSKPETPQLVASRPAMVRRRYSGVAIALIVLLIAAGAAALWWFTRQYGAGSSAMAPIGEAVPGPTVALEQMATEPAPDEAPPQASAAEETPVTPPPAAVTPAAGAPDVKLELRFVDDSWVEVYDADGRRLMFDLGQGGSSRRLEGKPPLEVYLGNAAAVEVHVDGVPTSVPGGQRRGGVARFRVGTPPPAPDGET